MFKKDLAKRRPTSNPVTGSSVFIFTYSRDLSLSLVCQARRRRYGEKETSRWKKAERQEMRSFICSKPHFARPLNAVQSEEEASDRYILKGQATPKREFLRVRLSKRNLKNQSLTVLPYSIFFRKLGLIIFLVRKSTSIHLFLFLKLKATQEIEESKVNLIPLIESILRYQLLLGARYSSSNPGFVSQSQEDDPDAAKVVD